MAEELDLPYLAEYAKSNRASCKGCKGNIAKESLRLAVMIQSPKFDGKIPNWYHFSCFFGPNRVKTVADIKHFEQLRWDDQEKIKNKIVPHGSGGVQAGASSSVLKDFAIELAKSARSVCRGCEGKILKNSIRISQKDYDSDSARRFGPRDLWYHLNCFAGKRNEMEFYASGKDIPGFKEIDPENQAIIKEKLPAMKNAQKRPSEDLQKTPKRPAGEEAILKAQNEKIFEYRDKLQKNLSKKELQLLLEYNDQAIPPGESKVLDCLSDCMAFGALEPCTQCDGGQLVFSAGGYRCKGNMTEWTKCTHVTKTPERKPFEIPDDLKLNFPFLEAYKSHVKQRVFSSVEEAPSVRSSNHLDETDSVKAQLVLRNMQFAIVGKTIRSKADLTREISELGGKVVSKIDSNTTAVISIPSEVEKMTKKMEEAKAANVHVISEDFLSSCKSGSVVEAIKAKSISGWGGDPALRVASNQELQTSKAGKSKSSSSVVTMTLKGRSSVEPESGLEGIAHVLEEKNNIYNAVLGMVDVSRGTNSYYRLQLLESDSGKRYWVYRAWGRIGTTIGGNKLEKFDDKQDAKDGFCSLYEEKTGNCWKDRNDFVKYPNRFFPMDIDYGQDTVKNLRDMDSKVPSKLAKAVQNLVCTIFDVDIMKKALVEFEIDLNKMPLGKLSRKQIESAYLLLTDLQKTLSGTGNQNMILDLTNRFYTLIPHNFGLKSPPLLKSEDVIKAKIAMLDSLLEIEIAYNLLKSSEENVNAIDAHYEKLKTDIQVLEKDNEEFKLIKTYLKNTHAATHNQYGLKIKEVFKISRKGEASRFKPFKKLGNRYLLWHGSRITNYAGILSQGLRIAPPEAPMTGYMFGKGIYFADMVSKSANYCFATKENPVGLLLLCEVALGNMHELKHASYIEKLPAGQHSTKGIGGTHPDPSMNHVTKDGIIVPLGKSSDAPVSNTSLLYNEYIVYDVAQVNVKYLVQTDFKWKY